MLPRDIPIFSLEFVLTSEENPADHLGNYNELQIVTEEYLGRRFEEILSDTPAALKFTTVSLQTTTDPLIVDVRTTINLHIPGEVPKFDFLSAHAKKAFEVVDDKKTPYYSTNFTAYLEELSLMSDTNPFQSTVKVIYRDYNPADDDGAMLQVPESKSTLWKSLVPLLGALSLAIVMITILLCMKIRKADEDDANNDPLRFERGHQGIKYSDNETESSNSPLGGVAAGADEESLRHLDEVRREYCRASNLQEVSLVDEAKRIGELKYKPEPVGTYDAPMVLENTTSEEEIVEEYEDEYEEEEEEAESATTDEPTNLAKFEHLLGRALGNDEEEEEYEEYEEEEYDEESVIEDALIQLDAPMEPPEEKQEQTTQLVTDAPAARADPPAAAAKEEEEVGKKDLFSYWETKESNGGKKASSDAPAAPPKKDLFSFWEKKATDPEE